MTEVTALEHSTLIVPYECLNRSFRNAQKVVDREVSHINSSNDKLRKLSSKSHASVKETCNELDDILNKLHSLRKKSIDALRQEQHKLEIIHNRLLYLKEQAGKKKNMLWKCNRLNRMLVDYFLRNGYYDTAIQMAENSEIKDLVDIDLFLIAKEVENSLCQKNLSMCLQWCHSNKSKLKKLQSTLELNLRIQEFVELIKSNQRLDALLYARKHFTSSGNDTALAVPEIQKTVMALLAFQPDTQIKRYQELFDPDRWILLIEQFRKENLAIHQLNSQSMLEIVLQCGLASMKTPHCFHEEEQKKDCPVCNKVFNELAKPLPFAHSSQSRLLCHISGNQMNEHNHPLMLPNGNVYGELSIHEKASDSIDNTVVCPRTLEAFALEEVKKIFIM